MEKTLLNVKTEKRLKIEAQKVAKELGLPLGTIINAYLRDLVRQKRVVFSSPPTLNIRTQKILKNSMGDIKRKKNAQGPFSYTEAMRFLDSL